MPVLKDEGAFVRLEGFRAVHWLRHAADLSVSTTDSFTGRLLRAHHRDSITTRNEDGNDLITVLFFHVRHLPRMQSLVHYYHSDLMKTMGTSAAASRLEQFTRIQQTEERLQKQMDKHLERLEFVLGDWYETGDVTVRTAFRRQLGSLWHSFANASRGGASLRENTMATGMAMTLRVLLRILRGVQATSLSSPTTSFTGTIHQPLSSYRHLLFYSLLPLHTPNAMILWRDQAALLELYHRPLVQCIAVLLKAHPQWIGPAVSVLIGPDVWSLSNTPKTILLLHEIDALLKLSRRTDGTTNANSTTDPNSQEPIAPPIDRTTWHDLLRQLSACMASDNSRLSEQGLQFFRSNVFKSMVHARYDESVPVILKALVRRGEVPWNPTVQKMTYHVLQELREEDKDRFTLACDRAFGGGPASTATTPSTTPTASTSFPTKPSSFPAEPTTRPRASKAPDFSLQAGMGKWRPPKAKQRAAPATMLPPPARRPAGRPPAAGQKPPMGVAPSNKTNDRPSKTPPLTVTGVAPWAQSRPSNAGSMGNTVTGKKKAEPPVTITGVAPWAVAQSNTTNIDATNKRSRYGAADSDATDVDIKTTTDGAAPSSSASACLAHVLNYMDKIKPPKEHTGTSHWAQAQMAETPTLQPSLKFHDLVFGHELGSGAFGTVKYARQIDRTVTRSRWSEFAVKIVSTQKIVELGYEKSVQREMAILRHLSHPGIARLISSFRFRDGAYMVLEYASKGDLHGVIRKTGSLSHESAQFVVGEIVAALQSIHRAGFIYGDLKPENILLTETGHIKLTDFGGSRPYTKEAKQKLRTSSSNLLKDLRDGDWESKKVDKQQSEGWTSNDDNNDGGGGEMEVQDWSGNGGNTGQSEEKEADEKDAVSSSNNGDDDDDDDDDIRVEGTVAYLPPEVVLGGIPTTAADVWALGCVLYQCLTGRPPYLEDNDVLTKERIVSFEGSRAGSSETDPLFDGDHAKDLGPESKSFIRRLLSPSLLDRPTLSNAATDTFFSGLDVTSLHKGAAPSLGVGTVLPKADAKWSRRQFSSIWAPQPKAYDLSDEATSLSGMGRTGPTADAPITEGDEAPVFFSITAGPKRIGGDTGAGRSHDKASTSEAGATSTTKPKAAGSGTGATATPLLGQLEEQFEEEEEDDEGDEEEEL